ncbi:MAG: response regulator [Methylorubrum populi]
MPNRLLIVEDDYFWADELSRGLASAGAIVLGPAASVAAALEILDREPCVDAAILDIKLRGTRAYAVADRLLERAVPFLILSGYDSSDLPTAYARTPWLEKPVSLTVTLKALDALLPSDRRMPEPPGSRLHGRRRPSVINSSP